MRIAVLMACHNRRAKTIECLRRLRLAAERATLPYRLYLFDDGSSDGTAAAVKEQEPDAVILTGDGSYFWNRSMNSAFDAAIRDGFSAYLWLNDDTMLDIDGIARILAGYRSAGEDVMVVGAVCDPDTGHLSYGGSRRISRVFRPFFAVEVEPNGAPQDVDVVCGNVVLIPHGIAVALGNLDPVFEHAMGDTDYSMRARKKSIRILQSAAYVGTCSRNAKQGTHYDRGLGMFERIRQVFSRKGLPWRSWLVMCRRHGGPLWPIHFIWAYAKVILGRS